MATHLLSKGTVVCFRLGVRHDRILQHTQQAALDGVWHPRVVPLRQVALREAARGNSICLQGLVDEDLPLDLPL